MLCPETYPRKEANPSYVVAGKRGGFTLIELLVVISVVVLLLAILLPSLQRARNQARAVKCQANLRQWGLIISTYLQDNDGRFWKKGVHGSKHDHWFNVLEAWRYENLCFCPMAMNLNPDLEKHTPGGYVMGSKFTAWQIPFSSGPSYGFERGSYGYNHWTISRGGNDSYWGRATIKSQYNVPFLFDNILYCASPLDFEQPPEYDDTGPRQTQYFWGSMSGVCIDRHNGGINVLFMDWSARKVGLKELWTLKWNRKFDTAGPFTIAGGVKPTDWPEWMRKFKDY